MSLIQLLNFSLSLQCHTILIITAKRAADMNSLLLDYTKLPCLRWDGRNGAPQGSEVSAQLSMPVLQTPKFVFRDGEQHPSELMLYCFSLRGYVLLFRLQILNSWRLWGNLLVNSVQMQKQPFKALAYCLPFLACKSEIW